MISSGAKRLTFDLFDSLPDAVIVSDRDGTICFANSVALELTGYEPADLIGMPRRLLGLPKVPVEPCGAKSRASSSTTLRTACGIDHPVDVSYQAIEGGQYLVVVIRLASRLTDELPGSLAPFRSPVLDTLAVGVIIVDESETVAYVNRPAVETLGSDPQQSMKVDLRALFQPRDADSSAGEVDTPHFLDTVLEDGSTVQDFEAVLIRGDGTRTDVSVNASPIDSDNGHHGGAIVSFADISRQKHSERQMTIQRQVLEMIAVSEDPDGASRLIIEHVEETIPGTRVGLYLLDMESFNIDWIAASDVPPGLGGASLEDLDEALHEFCSEVLTSRQPRILPHVDPGDDEAAAFSAKLDGYGIRACWCYPLEFAASGSVGVLCLYRDQPGAPNAADESMIGDTCSLARVALDRVQIERDLQHQSFNDSLTGLPNRILLMDRLELALQRAAHSDNQITLLLLDIDQFQMVNDSLGYPAGDQMLKQAAGRLRSCLRQDDLVARFTSDEFGILLEHISSEADAINVVMRIQRAFAVPLKVAGVEVYASLSIGMAVANEPESDPDALVRYADIAMHRAKESGQGQFAIFSPAQDLSRVPKIALQSRLHRALAADALQLHYQPLVSLADSTASGYEALVRWHDKDFGDVSPDEFLPLADRSGIMAEITAWVLDRSVAQICDWGETYGRELFIGVNVSPSELHDPLLVEQVGAVVDRYQIEPQRLVLEMTEHALVDISGRASQILERLRNLGIRIALDDFGTGFSSLSYLERLPVDFIKIDQTFIQAARGGASRAPVAAAMVDLARKLGMISVAEGIETAEDERVARQLGCDLSQGYFYGRPQPEPNIRSPYEPHTGSS